MNKDIEQLISSYIEGDISEQNKIIIENNIKNNKEFALKVDSIKNIITSLNNTQSISTSKEFLSNLDNHKKLCKFSNFSFSLILVFHNNSGEVFVIL